jgi:radical SAM protein with 4Fe4S-binding SPASM domain
MSLSICSNWKLSRPFLIGEPVECPQVPQISYSRFGEAFYKQVYQKRIPVNGSIELTFRCNLRCVHCYCNLPPSDPNAIEREMKTDEVLGILDQIAEAGCLWFLMTGGEPLLRKDTLEILIHAKKKGLITSLFTNGTLVTPAIADHLAEWQPHSVEVTLYGATQKTYERITRVPGSFQRCLRGIELLLDRSVPLALKTMAMTLNQEEIFEIKAFAEERGLKFRFDPMLNARLDGSKTPCDFRLAPEEVVELDLEDEQRSGEWREFCGKFLAPVSSEYLFSCGAGISAFHIDPYGQMSACEMVRFQSFSLRRNRFKQGWDDVIPRILEQKPRGHYPCARCELISLCGQCPGWAWLENGSLERPVEYLCRIAHLRAQAFHTLDARK